MSELSTRMAAIEAALKTAMPGRVVTRVFLDFGLRARADLEKGIFTLVSQGERGYRNYNGREAMDGRHRMMLIGQIVVPEAQAATIEDVEFEMVADVKGFLRALPPAIAGLVANGFQQSGQMDKPWGWVAFDLELLA